MSSGIPQGRSRRGSLRSDGDGGGLAASKGSVSKTTSGSDLVDNGIDAGMDKAAAAASKAGLKGKVAAAALKNEHVRDAVKNVAGDKIDQAKEAAADRGLANQGANNADRDQAFQSGKSAMDSQSPRAVASSDSRPGLAKRGSLLSPAGKRGLLGRKAPAARAARAAAHVATAPIRLALAPIVIPLLIIGLILLLIMGAVMGLGLGGDDGIIEQKKQFIPIVNVHAPCENKNTEVDGGTSGGTAGGGSTISGFTYLSQMASPDPLPTGCEITSLTMVLKFYGLDVSKGEMADNYLEKGELGHAHPNERFVGNPRDKDGYGCFAPVIVKAANSAISAKGNASDFTVSDKTGTGLFDLYSYIDKGVPVVIWGTQRNETAGNGNMLSTDSGDFQWIRPEHCMVLVGHGDGKVYVADPLNESSSATEYDESSFKSNYEAMGSRAVVVESKNGSSDSAVSSGTSGSSSASGASGGTSSGGGLTASKTTCTGGGAGGSANAKDKLVEVAKAEVGYEPDSGGGKYTSDLGMAPQEHLYCSEFASWCFFKAFGEDGKKVIGASSWPMSCNAWEKSIRTLGDDHVKDKDPEVGDVVIAADHHHTRGVVYEVNGDEYKTIEGNAGPKTKESTYTVDGKWLFLIPDYSKYGGGGDDSSGDSGSSSSDYSDVLLIGDSITADSSPVHKALLDTCPGITINSQVGRAFGSQTNGAPDPVAIDYAKDHAKDYKRVVIEIGTNVGLTKEQCKEFIDTAPSSKFYFVNIYDTRNSHNDSTNQAIDEAASEYGAKVIDWCSAAKAHPEYLADVCHPGQEGAQPFADLVKKALGSSGSEQCFVSDPCNIEKEDNGSSGGRFTGEWVFLDQNYGREASKDWPHKNSDGYVECSDWSVACGVVALGMVVATYSGDLDKYNPNWCAAVMGNDNGMNQGPMIDKVNSMKDVFHLNATGYTNIPVSNTPQDTWETIKKACAGGGCCVFYRNMYSGSHWIVITGMTDSEVIYADPGGGVERTESFSDFVAKGGAADAIGGSGNWQYIVFEKE